MLWTLAFAICLLGCSRLHQKSIAIDREPMIRVLLTHASGKIPPLISVNGPYQIVSADKKILAQGNQLVAVRFYARDSMVWMGEQGVARELWVLPLTDSRVEVNRVPYYGNLQCITSEPNQLQVINTLPLENYVSCVLGGEMPLSWAPAALQAQAIVSRTYALYEKAQKAERPFDVYDSVLSQVYPGIPGETPLARALVRDTTGMVLLYNNALFKTFFHSTCGGHTARITDVFAYPDITPLGGRECPFCRAGKYFEWEYHADFGELQQMARNLRLPSCNGIAAGKQDGNGRLITIDVYYAALQKKSVEATAIRKALGEERLRSTCFTMEESGNGMLFRGRGWGHGIGMCQTGAGQMAAENFTPIQIVEFYYPGAKVYRLWK